MSKCGKIGAMRHRITIETPTRVSDGMGGATITWATHATAWSKVEPMSANQVFWARHLEHRVTHKITLRYVAGITSDMRVSFESRIFHIKGIRDLEERNRFIELTCEEGAAS